MNLDSPEAEKGIIASLFHADEIQAAGIAKTVSPEMFTSPDDAALFSLLLDFWRDRKPREIGLVTAEARNRKIGEGTTAAHFVSERYAYLLTAGTWDHYADELRGKWLLRKVTDWAGAVASRASLADEPEAFVRELQGELMQLSPAQTTRMSWKDLLYDAVERLECYAEHGPGLQSGIRKLDLKTGGWSPGSLVVVSGQTKSGKSALAGNIAENVSLSGKRVAFFSLEMTPQEVADRALASQSRVNLQELRWRKMNVYETANLTEALGRLTDCNVEVVEDAFTLDSIVTTARELHAKEPVALVVVDYIQLVHGPRRQGEGREREVAAVSRGMKRLAVELGTVVIALSQLNEDGQLRESRAIGQDANCVLAVEKIGKDGTGRQLRIVVQRSGESDVEIPVRWEPKFTRFEEA